MFALPIISLGMAAALGCCLVFRLIWAYCADRNANLAWHKPGMATEIRYVVLHAALGAGMGLLFWLSWGFSALVHLHWWQRGFVFGLTHAIVLIVLPTLIARSLIKPSPFLLPIAVIDGSITVLVSSLASSWAWSLG